jgi:hypothetical protein
LLISPNVEIVTLHRNYRSTQPVLSAPNGVIGFAKERFTNLWTERTSTRKPQLVSVRDAADNGFQPDSGQFCDDPEASQSAYPAAPVKSADLPHIIASPAFPSPLLIRVHPNVRCNLARLGQLDHVRGRRVAALNARPALKRRL